MDEFEMYSINCGKALRKTCEIEIDVTNNPLFVRLDGGEYLVRSETINSIDPTKNYEAMRPINQ